MKIRKDLILEPVWPESFMEVLGALCKALKIEGREVTLEQDTIIVRVTDCELQKAIAKAGVTDCDLVLR